MYPHLTKESQAYITTVQEAKESNININDHQNYLQDYSEKFTNDNYVLIYEDNESLGSTKRKKF